MKKSSSKLVLFLCVFLISLSCEKEDINEIDNATINETEVVSKSHQTYHVTVKLKLQEPFGYTYITPGDCLAPFALHYLETPNEPGEFYLDKVYGHDRTCSTLKNLPAKGIYIFNFEGYESDQLLPEGYRFRSVLLPKVKDISRLPTSSSGNSRYKILELEVIKE